MKKGNIIAFILIGIAVAAIIFAFILYFIMSNRTEGMVKEYYYSSGKHFSSIIAEPTTEKPTEFVTQKSETVIFDNRGITISYTGLGKDYPQEYVKLKIENNTNKAYVVQARNTSVNGYMITPIFSPAISAGKTANSKMIFREEALRENGIESIENVELYFHIYVDNDLDDSFDTEVISFDTN